MKVFFGGGVNDTDPVYLGIDQSYSGFAITAYQKSGSYYTEVYKSDLRGIDRLRDIQAHMMNWMYEFNDNLADVAMEGYAYGSQMANMLGELGGTVKLTLRDTFDTYPLIVPPTVLKKYATGKGQGISKSQILMNVYKKWGVEFTDDNAADSYVLAHLVSGMGTRKYEKEVYAKLSSPDYRER